MPSAKSAKQEPQSEEMSWDEIINHPTFQKMSPQGQWDYKNKLFDEYFGQEPAYLKMSDAAKQQYRLELVGPDQQPTPAPQLGFIEGIKQDWTTLKNEFKQDPNAAISNTLKGGIQNLTEGALWLGDKPYQFYKLATTGSMPEPVTENPVIKKTLTPTTMAGKLGAFVETGAEMALGEGIVKAGMRAIPLLRKAEQGRKIAGSLKEFGKAFGTPAVAQATAAGLSTKAHGGSTSESLMAGGTAVVLGNLGQYLSKYLPEKLVAKLIKADVDPELSLKRLNPVSALAKQSAAVQSILDEGIVATSKKSLGLKVDKLIGGLTSKVRTIVKDATKNNRLIDMNSPIQPAQYMRVDGSMGGILPGLEDVLPPDAKVGLVDALKQWITDVLPQKMSGFDPEVQKTLLKQIAGEFKDGELVTPGILQQLTHMTYIEEMPGNQFWMMADPLPAVGKTIMANPLHLLDYKTSLGKVTFNSAKNGSPELDLINSLRRHIYRGIDNLLDQLHPEMRDINNRIGGLVEARSALASEAEEAAKHTLGRLGMTLMKPHLTSRIAKGLIGPAIPTLAGGLPGAAIAAVGTPAWRSTLSRTFRAQFGRKAGPVFGGAAHAVRFPAQVAIGSDEDPMGYRGNE